MFQLFNKRKRMSAAEKHQLIFFSLIVFFIFSCSFADLRPITVTINPSDADTVLPDTKTPVSISFDTDMQKNETEKLITVSYFGGNVECDTHWDNGTLFLTPVADWIPGVRYLFTVNGTASSIDKRDVILSYYMPFFAVTNAPAPYLVSYKPENGASVGVTKENGAYLHLVFSDSMEKHSVEDVITIDGFTNKVFTWNEYGTELTVSNKEQLSAWATIKWKLGTDVYNTKGIPLVREEGAQFTTDIDIKVPRVDSVFPMLKIRDKNDAYSWIDTGLKIENGLGASNAIGIKFTKALDSKTISNCIRFDPPFSGTLDQLSDNTIIFVPDSFPLIDTLYRLTVSSEIKDTFGLKLEDEYQTNFIADIPYLKINNMSFTGKDTTTHLNGDEVFDGAVTPVFVSADKKLMCIIEFLLPVTDIQKQLDFVKDIRLETFFPDTLNPVALARAEWVLGGSDNMLVLDYEGIEKSSDPSYYKLYFPGGSTGLSDGKGSYLKNSVSIYMEVK